MQRFLFTFSRAPKECIEKHCPINLPVLFLVFVMVAFGSCSEEQSKRGAEPGNLNQREAATHIARSQIEWLEQQKEPFSSIRKDFVFSFVTGFNQPDSKLPRKFPTEAARRGFSTGRECRRAYPARVDDMMAVFGYVTVDTAGIWVSGFERNEFRPSNHPDQRWWLTSFGDTRLVSPPEKDPKTNGVHVRVKGYLSPEGQYGHLGGYRHELYVTAIVPADGQSLSADNP